MDAHILTRERTGAPFQADTTLPLSGNLTARLEGSAVHWTFEVQTTTSPFNGDPH